VARKNAKAKPKTKNRKQPPKERVQVPPAADAIESGSYRAKVRMYRQGLGDCFLITLPRKSGTPFYILIDCGVILGTSDAGTKMKKVVQNILDTTAGKIDVLVATHEHWDHLSGFLQAKELFQKLAVGTVWLAWTEDPADALARKLKSEYESLRLALRVAGTQLRIAGADTNADVVESMLEFFGAFGSGTTTDALQLVKSLSKSVKFCHPSDPPVELDGVEARVYFLGPPHDEAMIKRFNPSKSHPETYEMRAAEMFRSNMDQTAEAFDADAPFDAGSQIPENVARELPHFQNYYWGEDEDSSEKDQSWRRIDTSWLEQSEELALQLDSATNNTSLAMALELDGESVLLFAADAQVGNWLSWQDLSWSVDGKTVTGPDLLKRTILYKVGHHGSHNATLKEKGLELMTALKLALIPVDHAMAVKKRWGNMPLPGIVDRLDKATSHFVLRIDEDVPREIADRVNATDLYYEVSV